MVDPKHLEALLEPGAYPHPCAEIRLIETHISWVFLTGEYAYKLKKPVDFGFLDFSTLEKRRYFCTEEIRCNAAFAPEFYLGVVVITTDSDHGYRLGGDGRVIDYAVKMRQFDDSLQLDRALERDALTPAMLRQFARDLGAIYDALPEIPESANIEQADKVLAPMLENFRVLENTDAARAYAPSLARLQQWTQATHASMRQTLVDRALGGWIRERHGDLHLSNLVDTDAGVRAFDCIEFSLELRLIDAINDIAFLFMDCSVRGRADLAYTFIDAYLEATGDYSGIRLLRFYAVYRSIVRAKVAALRLQQSYDAPSERRLDAHLTWASNTIDATAATLVLMCGPSGCGKSWLAERIAPLLPGIRLRSDIIRRELAGLGRTESSKSAPGAGIYTQAMGAAVYTRLLELSRDLLDTGESVIVDATFLAASDRRRFQALAVSSGCDCMVVQCEAPRQCLEQRVVERLAKRVDPSEATPAVLHRQLGVFEPPAAPECVIQVRTDREVDIERLVDDIRAGQAAVR